MKKNVAYLSFAISAFTLNRELNASLTEACNNFLSAEAYDPLLNGDNLENGPEADCKPNDSGKNKTRYITKSRLGLKPSRNNKVIEMSHQRCIHKFQIDTFFLGKRNLENLEDGTVTNSIIYGVKKNKDNVTCGQLYVIVPKAFAKDSRMRSFFYYMIDPKTQGEPWIYTCSSADPKNGYGVREGVFVLCVIDDFFTKHEWEKIGIFEIEDSKYQQFLKHESGFKPHVMFNRDGSYEIKNK